MAGTSKMAALAAAGVAAGALAGAAAVKAQRWYCLQVLKTRGGIARVHMVSGADGEPVRVLQEGGVFQSATYLGSRWAEPAFAYYRAFDAMFAGEAALGHPIRRVLMIGGGGFAYPKHLLTTRAGVHMDVAEFDPAIVRTARRWFYLDELEARLANPATARGNSLRVIVEDGRTFLEDQAAPIAADRSRAYDAIVNDAFSGREPARVIATVEAARAVRACLAPAGLYLENVVSRDAGRDVSFLRDRVATMREAFARVHVLQTSDAEFGGEDNYLVIATDGDAAFEGAIAYDGDFPGTPLRD